MDGYVTDNIPNVFSSVIDKEVLVDLRRHGVINHDMIMQFSEFQPRNFGSSAAGQGDAPEKKKNHPSISHIYTSLQIVAIEENCGHSICDR